MICLRLTISSLFISACLSAQPSAYSAAQIHAHNDYDHNVPFTQAYALGVGSIEADVHWIHDTLFVAHSDKQLRTDRLFESAYLAPLAAGIEENGGRPFREPGKILQLLIDIKTDAVPTISAVVKAIERFPELTHCANLRLVISGNQPAPEVFDQYPLFLLFDGKIGDTRYYQQLSRIPMFSASFSQFSKWKGEGPMPEADRRILKSEIDSIHQWHKLVRFWGAPDNLLTWKTFQELGIDYINTNQIDRVTRLLEPQRLPVYGFDPEKLLLLKHPEPGSEAARQRQILLKLADASLQAPLHSVMEKAFLPPSGNKHDYMSLAPYYWPDLSKPDSLPYIRRDGSRNPMINKITDKQYLVEMCDRVQDLAFAWYISGEKKYAERAVQWLRYWFLDSTTYMHPNLDFGQAVPGINNGRGIGIIETRSFSKVTDAVGLLRDAGVMTADEHAGIQHWFMQYLQWLLHSKNGTDERHAKNNHGTWYDMQVLCFALFVQQPDWARTYMDTVLQRIPVQFLPDGRQPLELERNTALGYATFNLEAWFHTAVMASRLGWDIWDTRTENGQGLRQALNWLIPYALGDTPWPYKQQSPYAEWDDLRFVLMEADHYYTGDHRYREALKRLKQETGMAEILYGDTR